MEVTAPDLQRTYSLKDGEDLLSLHRRGTLTDTAYQALEAELVRRGIAIPARPLGDDGLHEAEELYARTTLRAHWKGEASLASAYWLVGTLGSWLFGGAIALVYRFVPILAPVALVFLVAFLIFAWVSIWRCWKNSCWSGWGYLARVQVALCIFGVAASVLSLALQP